MMTLINQISQDLHLDVGYVSKTARTASYLYKTYAIPKRTGGLRTICQPSRQLKLLQVWLTYHLFARMPVHRAATAYVHGRSILDNANAHRTNSFLLRLDFQRFFESITAADVVHLLEIGSKRIDTRLSSADRQVVANLVCKEGCLTIGAPSSPYIANATMYEFDKYWWAKSRRSGVVYTRYADDLCFSTNTPNVLSELHAQVREYVRGMEHPRLVLNEEKDIFTSRKRHRSVTGLVLTTEGNVSIGRGRKRYVRSLVFRAAQNRLGDQEKSYLRGYLAFVAHVEPSFLQALKRRYGEESIDMLMSQPNTPIKNVPRVQGSMIPFRARSPVDRQLDT